MRAIRLHPEARDEIDVAALRYEEARPGHGTRFLAEIGPIVDLVRAAPEAGTRWRRGPMRVWRAVRFPYVVAYAVEPDHVLLLTVAHTSRRPGYWLERRER